MDDYFFLVSSLRHLRFDAPPPLTVAEFEAQACEHLSSADRAVFAAADLDPELAAAAPDTSAGGRFRVWETQLRNTLALRRQNDLKLPPADWQRPCSDLVADIPENVTRAMQSENPLETARALDRMRWDVLDLCAAGHAFDVDFLAVYKLKLALLAKWQPRTAENGRGEFAGCLDQIEKMNLL